MFVLDFVLCSLGGELDGAGLAVDTLDKGADVHVTLVVVVAIFSVAVVSSVFVAVVTSITIVAIVTSIAIVAVVTSVVVAVVSSITIVAVVSSIVVAVVSSVVVTVVSSVVVAVVVAGIVGAVWCRSIVTANHLNRNNTTKRTSPSRVLATNQADVVLASNLTGALLVGGNSGGKRMIGFSASIVTATVPLNVLGNLDVLPGLGSAIRVNHAGVGAGTIAVDLVQSHLDVATLRDLGKLATHLGHDSLRTRFDIVVTGTNRLTHSLCGLTSETSGILLERVSTGSISRSAGVNTQSHALATSVADSVGDDAVSRDKLGSKDGGSSEKSLERHF